MFNQVELRFLAPKSPGNYTYSVILRSDSYLDFDVIQQIKVSIIFEPNITFVTYLFFKLKVGCKTSQEDRRTSTMEFH